jgi:hypothetical protein
MCSLKWPSSKREIEVRWQVLPRKRLSCHLSSWIFQQLGSSKENLSWLSLQRGYGTW